MAAPIRNEAPSMMAEGPMQMITAHSAPEAESLSCSPVDGGNRRSPSHQLLYHLICPAGQSRPASEALPVSRRRRRLASIWPIPRPTSCSTPGEEGPGGYISPIARTPERTHLRCTARTHPTQVGRSWIVSRIAHENAPSIR